MDDPTDLLISLAPLLGGWIAAMIFLFLLRRQDHFSWVLARAPSLPISVLAAGDDAWVRGAIRCDDPLICPWFEIPCVAYRYEIEKKVTVTRHDKDGNTTTHSEWRT
ncbi:MAG: hypothetical protein Fur0037_03750 [Planctomycetota bacterium]